MKKLLPGISIVIASLFVLYSCASSDITQQSETSALIPITEANRPDPDPRIGLTAGLFDAGEAIWNLRLLSSSPPPEDFIGSFGSDLAFKDNYVFQGNFNGFIIWDISDPSNPEVVVDYLCPASQSDVSVYGDLLFVSGEGLEGRLDCGTEGIEQTVSEKRLRGIRIFDISDLHNPKYISNVQTCRGSHTHSLLVDPNDEENIYVYVSGSAPVRPDEELPDCSSAFPNEDPNSALFRIEVIKVPLANPELAAIESSPRIFDNLEAPPVRDLTPEERAAVEQAREEGAFIGEIMGQEQVIPNGMARRFLAEIMEERSGTEPTAADTAALRERLPEFIDDMLQDRGLASEAIGPNQCHDITLYPELGIAGGACEGYGLLLDISDPARPVRIDAVADSNFAYWHSATFNNDGSTVIFTDEWGGGVQPKCRETDPLEWGANAIFTIDDNGKMEFQSYFKMPAPQTGNENCVAHNGSLIPIPGRDIMVQSWYQGGINVFDFTDPAKPVEIAFHDRGPISANFLQPGGSWSIYWYNGLLINSTIARGLDIFELIPSDFITMNEIAAANTVKMDYFNPQGQPRFTWPASIELALAYTDQLERSGQLDRESLQLIRKSIGEINRSGNSEKSTLLTELATEIENMTVGSDNNNKINALAATLKELAADS
jgi:hypothetical protein